MLRKNALYAIFASLLILIIAGCSSDEENPITPTPTPSPPEFMLKEITFPQHMLNSTDPMAQQAIATVENAMDFKACGCLFAPPEGAETIKESSGEWEYKWKTGELTQTLQIASVSGRDSWKIFYDGVKDGNSFNNWRFMDAVQSADLSSGHVTLFKPATLIIDMEWVWYTLQLSEYKFIKQYFGDPPYKIDITVKSDQSGKIDVFKPNSSGNMVYDIKFAWKADGSGSYWTFEDGKQTGYGTWP